MGEVWEGRPSSLVPLWNPLNKPLCGTPSILLRLLTGLFFVTQKCAKIELFLARFSCSAPFHGMGALVRGPLFGLNWGERNGAPLTSSRAFFPSSGWAEILGSLKSRVFMVVFLIHRKGKIRRGANIPLACGAEGKPAAAPAENHSSEGPQGFLNNKTPFFLFSPPSCGSSALYKMSDVPETRTCEFSKYQPGSVP